MTFNVRIHAYPGIVAALQSQVVQQSTDSVYLLRDPYISGQKLTSAGATPVPSTALPANTRFINVEVDDGNTIRYEIQMGAAVARQPGTISPSLSGKNLVFASEGAVFSFVDAASV